MKETVSRIWWNWIGSWIDLATSVITIITLGKYTPFWTVDFVIWRLKKETARAKNREIEQKGSN